MTSRRGFLGLLAGGAAIAVSADLAELLAPCKTIFLPPKGGWKHWSDVTVQVNGRELWVFGETTTEVWTYPTKPFHGWSFNRIMVVSNGLR